jgi:hypothetical protein
MTLVHLTDSQYNSSLLHDQSGNFWDVYLATQANNRNPSTTYFGPRYRDWASKFHEGDYYNVTDTANLRLGTSNFTIEFWYKGLRQDATQHYVMGKGNQAGVTSGNGWVIGLTSGYFMFYYDAQGNTTTTGATALSRDTWYHVAIVRSSTATNGLRIFINGVLDGVGTSSGNYTSTETLYIGADRTAATGFWGLLTDIRINNTAVYSTASVTVGASIFTAPTAALSQTLTGTVLCISMLKPHHDTIVTNQLQGLTITRGGTYIRRIIDSPFLVNTAKLTGNGAYSLAPHQEGNPYYRVYDVNPARNLQFGTGQFTVECWVYLIVNDGSNRGIMGKGTGNDTSGTGWSFWIDSSGYLRWSDVNASLNSSPNNSMTQGAWYHVAAARVNTLASGFGMWVNGAVAYTGTVSTNYNNTDYAIILNSRNAQFNSYMYYAGLRVSGTARYTPGTPFGTTVEPSSGAVTFLDTSMTVDANTWMMFGTTANNGATLPAGIFDYLIDYGTTRYVFPRRANNELRTGIGSPTHRHGHSGLMYRDSSQDKISIVDSGTNFTFGTGDFSMEFWCYNRNFNEFQYFTTTYNYLLSLRSGYTDTQFAIRQNYQGKLEVWYAGRIILLDNYTLLRHFVWTHICLQRVNGMLAFYVNGRKRSEVVFTASLAAPQNSRIVIGNDQYSGTDYSRRFNGAFCDFRVCKTTAAYGSYTASGPGTSSSNPEYFQVPTTFLPVTSSTVCLWSAQYPTYRDASPANNYIDTGGRTDGNFTSAWNPYIQSWSPYSGIPFDYNAHAYGSTSSGSEWYSTGPVQNDSVYHELSFITRLSSAWTAEMWIWSSISNPASPTETIQILYTATSAGHEGFRIIRDRSNASNSWNDVTFEFWTAHNSGVQRIYTTGYATSYWKSHCFNHIAVVWDPTRTNKIAMFINGYRVATATTLTPGQKTWQTYRLASDSRTGPARISNIARYNNDSTTYTIPTAFWAYDQYSVQLVNHHFPFADACHRWPHYSYGSAGRPNYRTKRYGANSTMTFMNYDTTVQTDYIIFTAQEYQAFRPDTRYQDFTVECWVNHMDTTAGGRAINASVGNVLWLYANNMAAQINPTGYWRFRQASGGGTGLASTNTQGYFDYNPSTYLVSTVTSKAMDYICMMRKGGIFYWFINGIYVNAFPTTRTGTYPGGQGPTTENGDLDYATADFTIGADYTQSVVTGWTGHLHDFRFTMFPRYETRAVQFDPYTITLVSSDTYIIYFTGDLTRLHPNQPISFSGGFGSVGGGTTYYIKTLDGYSMTVSASVGAAAIATGSQANLTSITGTTQSVSLAVMTHIGTDRPALPRTLFPTA